MQIEIKPPLTHAISVSTRPSVPYPVLCYVRGVDVLKNQHERFAKGSERRLPSATNVRLREKIYNPLLQDNRGGGRTAWSSTDPKTFIIASLGLAILLFYFYFYFFF